MSHQVIRSPCIGVCDLDEHGYCRGCRRTLDEVAGWINYTHAERDAIIADLGRRKARPTSGEEPER